MKLNNLAVACIFSLTAVSLSAATLEGQSFEDNIKLGSRELRLNGLGLRAVFFIKGYVAGLYLNEKGSTLQEISAMLGPKRLQLRMLRGAGPDDFNSALVSGIRENASVAELAALNRRIAELERLIVATGATVTGDVINFDYVPGFGTTLTVNGVSQGKAIAGADFYNAVLAIFVGDRPVDERLKKGLLGQL
ncbi:MAG: chalcone isomerase family protein [Rhodoferax sp.]|uniref:chalcone isomerase family protein n=1 Tax=Rhodoferax sp. TaxID=50421 RepID=UPI00272305A0|nr:chalcone isomerase family protein [Rhodoferax sp.]MDO8450692.1 chalcone isomerase family protein [Rhodoferax sp.]